jgi:hypothetical protein
MLVHVLHHAFGHVLIVRCSHAMYGFHPQQQSSQLRRLLCGAESATCAQRPLRTERVRTQRTLDAQRTLNAKRTIRTLRVLHVLLRQYAEPRLLVRGSHAVLGHNPEQRRNGLRRLLRGAESAELPILLLEHEHTSLLLRGCDAVLSDRAEQCRPRRNGLRHVMRLEPPPRTVLAGGYGGGGSGSGNEGDRHGRMGVAERSAASRGVRLVPPALEPPRR